MAVQQQHSQRDTSSLNPKTQKKGKEKRKTEGLAPTKNLRDFEPEPTRSKKTKDRFSSTDF
jgi:hypothetical protein